MGEKEAAADRAWSAPESPSGTQAESPAVVEQSPSGTQAESPAVVEQVVAEQTAGSDGGDVVAEAESLLKEGEVKEGEE